MIKNFNFKQFTLAEVKVKWFQVLLRTTNSFIYIYLHLFTHS